jgi:uncharacterized membrane protein YhhN
VNTGAVAAFVVAIAFAVGDWLAVASGRRVLEYVCKPAATLAFLASAVALDATHADTRVWLCIALAFCLAGDTFLMLPRDAFVAGLGAFLVAHLCITIGYAPLVMSPWGVVIGAVAVLVVAVPLTLRFTRALARAERSELLGPVLAYVAAIAAMTTTALATGIVAAGVGATLFFVSDSLIAETRFVRPRAWAPVAIMVTYHSALAALVLSLVA